MVVVTGTKRSGTSMWMRALIEAGLPHIGEPFPARWGESIRDANPHGFHESRLRAGVFFGTNPDPTTGEYLTSEATVHHVVKVFIPGVVRTERAYLHRVVATMRHWRTYARSIEALYAREEAWLAEHPPEGSTSEQAVARARARRAPVPAPIEWFFENYELIRDFAVRRYPIHFSTYERTVSDPEAVFGPVLAWIGQGDPARAAAAVDRPLSRSGELSAVASEDAVEPADAQLFDDLHAAIHETSSVPRGLAEPLNEAWNRLGERYRRVEAARVADSGAGLDDDGPELR